MARGIIPWRDSADFSQDIKLGDRLFKLRSRWNTAYSFWTLDIYDKDDLPLLLAQKIVINTDILGRYTNPDLPSGQIYAIDAGNENRKVDRIGRDDIGVNVFIIYED